jgi:hypothetical protein
MILEKTDGGAIIVREAKTDEAFSNELLVQIVHGDLDNTVTLKGGILTIAASNGTWRYKIRRWCSQTSMGHLLGGVSTP